MKSSSWLFMLATLPAVALSQSPTPAGSHTIRGVVFDSVARAPLAGAVVQAALVDTAGGTTVGAPTRTFTAISDSTGAFQIGGLPAGRFAIGFQHDALNALGLESPVRGVDLGSDATVVVDLGVPSGQTIRGRLCPKLVKSAPDAALAGYAVDARTGMPARDTRVTVLWMELTLKRGSLQSTPRGVASAIGDDGRYVVCGIPTDGPVTVRTESSAYHVIEAAMTLPEAGVARRDFRLSGAKEVGGNATLTLRVVDDSGVAVSGGHAMISELGRDVPVEGGSGAIGDLPSGSWSVLVRAFGFQPVIVVADVSDGPTPMTVRLERMAVTLDTVNVVSDLPRSDQLTLAGIEKRMLVASGTLIRADNDALLSATEPSQAIRAARGFKYKSPTVVEARPYASGMKMRMCESVPSVDSVLGFAQGKPADRQVAVYVDGVRFRAGLETVNNALRPNQILAIEAYPEITSAPFLWRTNDACAVVAFWTKHAVKR